MLEPRSAADRVIVLSALRQWQSTQQECTALDVAIAERLARIPEARVSNTT